MGARGLVLAAGLLAVLAPAVRGHPDPGAAAAAVQAPPAPPADVAAVIGEYGGPSERLVVLERGGRLHADGGGLSDARLSRRAPTVWAVEAQPAVTLSFHREGARVVAVTLRDRRLQRRDEGAEVEARIRAGVKADPDRLRTRALAASPPAEPTPRRALDLVDLTSVDPAIRLDVRYATSNNFMGIVLYERPAAYLQRPAAEALGRAQRALAAKGYGLLVHDAYRPWFVTWMFWEATPPEHRIFVADPAKGSRHNRGAAVDLTLYDLRTGRAVEMPGRYDELSRRSSPDYPGGTSLQRWRRDLLRREMERQGFTVYPEEWWHFDYKDWRDWGIGNQTFAELARRRAAPGGAT